MEDKGYTNETKSKKLDVLTMSIAEGGGAGAGTRRCLYFESGGGGGTRPLRPFGKGGIDLFDIVDLDKTAEAADRDGRRRVLLSC